MKYQHRFRVDAPLPSVAEFHRHSAAMGAITPPPIVVQVHEAPERLAEGDEMEFTLWMGPLPLRWRAHIEDTTPAGFVDRMVKGPMRRWEHRHAYVAVDDRTTEIHDTVEVEARPHPFWGPVGLGMMLNLPVLFAFRAWQTRRLLRRQAAAGAWPPVLAQASRQSRSLSALILGTLLVLAFALGGALVARKGR